MEHHKSNTRLYHIWIGIKQRCFNKNCRIYYKYGGRNIKMDKQWKENFMCFYDWAVVSGYNDNLTIDRIDPSKGYYPSNCRWATYTEQNSHLSTPKTNTSGYVGVSWSNKEHKWVCVISINNKSKRIGCYNTQKDAVEARNAFITEHNLLREKTIYVGEKGVKKCTIKNI